MIIIAIVIILIIIITTVKHKKSSKKTKSTQIPPIEFDCQNNLWKWHVLQTTEVFPINSHESL